MNKLTPQAGQAMLEGLIIALMLSLLLWLPVVNEESLVFLFTSLFSQWQLSYDWFWRTILVQLWGAT